MVVEVEVEVAVETKGRLVISIRSVEGIVEESVIVQGHCLSGNNRKTMVSIVRQPLPLSCRLSMASSTTTCGNQKALRLAINSFQLPTHAFSRKVEVSVTESRCYTVQA